MKTILLLILIIFISNSICLAEFENYFTVEYIANNYNDACMFDSTTIFICGDFGTILKSTDSGFSWKRCDTKIDVKKSYWFSSIDAKGNTVIAVGLSGLIRTSPDKGETWNISDFLPEESYSSIVLTDSETGVAFAYPPRTGLQCYNVCDYLESFNELYPKKPEIRGELHQDTVQYLINNLIIVYYDQNFLKVTYDNNNELNLDVSIYNYTGKLTMSKALKMISGRSSIDVDLSSLLSGVYVYGITANGFVVKTGKFKIIR